MSWSGQPRRVRHHCFTSSVCATQIRIFRIHTGGPDDGDCLPNLSNLAQFDPHLEYQGCGVAGDFLYRDYAEDTMDSGNFAALRSRVQSIDTTGWRVWSYDAESTCDDTIYKIEYTYLDKYGVTPPKRVTPG